MNHASTRRASVANNRLVARPRPLACLAACLAVGLLCVLLPAKAQAWDPDDPWTLPDTGQTTCYNADGDEIDCPSSGEAFYGQDANYDGSQPRFEVYVDNANGNLTTDLNTGLMWQYEDDGTQRTWVDAETYCDDLDLDGHQDWRLPTVAELSYIVNAGDTSPACFSSFSCRSSAYWTSTTDAGGAGYAWYVSFFTGYVGFYDKSGTTYVRCVRGGP